MLTKDERNQVRGELGRAFSFAGYQRPQLTTIFLADVAEVVVVNDSGPADAAEQVLATCLAKGWRDPPTLLEMLLKYLVDTRGIGYLNQILQRVRMGPSHDPNPPVYNVTWLFEEKPFFDRADLRRQVQALVEGTARPILRVRPCRGGFGHSYSGRFLDHLNAQQLARVIPVELSPGTGPTYQLEDLVGAVAAQLGVDEPATVRTGSNPAATASRWILNRLNRGGLYILVLIHFGQRGLNPEVDAAIRALAQGVTFGQFRERIRLVLLDYDGPLDGVSPGDILDETLQPAAQVGVFDIEQVVADWNADGRPRHLPPLTGPELGAMATAILQAAPPEGKERLVALHTSLARLREA